MSRKWCTLVIALLMTAFVFLLEPANSETVEFTIEPAAGTISLHQTLNVTFQCKVNSSVHSSKPAWALHYPNTGHHLSTDDNRDQAKLEEHGISYYSGDTVANITILGLVENNRTQIWCTTLSSGETQFSEEIELIIAGLPLPPDPILKLLSSSQLEIQWDVPYSHDIDPIESYNIQILNKTSGLTFEDNIIQNRYNITTENGNVATECHHLIFNVTAVNALGRSAPGKVSGGFPIAPQCFSSEIDVAVTFYGNGTPIVRVSFEAPFICDYQTSNYTITIEDTAIVGSSPGLVHHSTYNGSSRLITETFDKAAGQLHPNHTYTLTVIAKDNAFIDEVSVAAVNFSTTFHSVPISPDAVSGLQLRDICIFAGGVFAVFVLTVVTIVIVTVCSRKRKLRKAPGSTMDLMLNSINRSRANSRMNSSQYDTPLKYRGDGSSLYETIDGYQKQTVPPPDKTTSLSWQQQEYLWKLQQRNLESKRSGGNLEADIPYQEMHSASKQGGYNSNRLSMPQGPQRPAVPHDNPNKLHAFQAESHAAALDVGSTSDAICMSPTDSETTFPHSQSFGDHLSTTAVVNESIGTAENDQGEYTYMSQAGTLAIQQSKLTLCTNGCVDVNNPEAHMHTDADDVGKNAYGKSKDSSDCRPATE